MLEWTYHRKGHRMISINALYLSVRDMEISALLYALKNDSCLQESKSMIRFVQTWRIFKASQVENKAALSRK